MITKVEGKCQFEGCLRLAAWLACKKPRTQNSCESSVPRVFCRKHAVEIINKANPEHVVGCPNCNCLFGVG